MSESDSISIRKIDRKKYLQIIPALAEEIWSLTYAEILTEEQIQYMMKMMYDKQILEEEFDAGVVFELICDGTLPIGFISYGPYDPKNEICKLHKLYLRHSYHGRGIGSAALQHVITEARKNNYRSLRLNVNKNNTNAIHAYQKNGFMLYKSEKNDIGNGYSMDDYVFTLDLHNNQKNQRA